MIKYMILMVAVCLQIINTAPLLGNETKRVTRQAYGYGSQPMPMIMQSNYPQAPSFGQIPFNQPQLQLQGLPQPQMQMMQPIPQPQIQFLPQMPQPGPMMPIAQPQMLPIPQMPLPQASGAYGQSLPQMLPIPQSSGAYGQPQPQLVKLMPQQPMMNAVPRPQSGY